MLDPETARQVRWRHAMNPQPVQPISNMQMRMDDYRAELRRFLFKELPIMGAVGAAIVFGVAYGLASVFPAGTAVAGLSWWQAALLLWILVLVPPFLMFKPEPPSERDVLADIALRRQVGMDDTVAP